MATIVTKAISRFENSTHEWKPFSGNGCPGWQPGQCSQPSPDAVSRTVAPVATITTSIAAAPIASRS